MKLKNIELLEKNNLIPISAIYLSNDIHNLIRMCIKNIDFNKRKDGSFFAITDSQVNDLIKYFCDTIIEIISELNFPSNSINMRAHIGPVKHSRILFERCIAAITDEFTEYKVSNEMGYISDGKYGTFITRNNLNFDILSLTCIDRKDLTSYFMRLFAEKGNRKHYYKLYRLVPNNFKDKVKDLNLFTDHQAELFFKVDKKNKNFNIETIFCDESNMPKIDAVGDIDSVKDLFCEKILSEKINLINE